MKMKSKSSFIIMILFIGMLLPLLNPTSITSVGAISQPSETGKRVIVYSETTTGLSLQGTISLNGWEGKAAITETSVSPYEGTSAINITMVDNAWNWWGIGLELSMLNNLADFAGGYLSFMINTSYAGNLTVGYQSAGGANAVLTLVPGMYGYQNDSTWHRVLLPIDELTATNPNADLSQVLNPLMIMSSGDAHWESIFIDDVYWQAYPPKKIVYSELTTGEGFEGTFTLNGWEGKAAISETTVSPYEGTTAINITMVDNAWNWWGIGLELSELENMEDYKNGYLSFMINTSYSGNLSVGYQSAGGANAVLTLVPGMYGYQNDSKWHRVLLPIDELTATNPNADLTKVLNPFMMMSAGDAYWESIFIDDIYWQMFPPRTIVYSELRIGDQLGSAISLNGWEGKAAISETTVSPYEGTTAINITMVDNAWNWWGIGLELSELENLQDYEGGYLSFMINTSYSGNLSVGYQSAGGANAVLTLVPGMYGYQNDSKWHRVLLPIDELTATNPNADLTKVLNPFMMMSAGDAYWESIFIDDIYWQRIAPDKIVYSDFGDGEGFEGTFALNGWEGKAAISETTVSPYEGTSALNITMVDNAWNWWGIGLELSELENMLDFQGGFLSFMINTSYSGNLSVGYQSAGGANAVITLVPGTYGYQNDSKWHRVLLPIDELTATNPNADLTKVLNPFMMMSAGDAYWESIFIDDIYWIPSIGEQKQWVPEVSDVFIELNDDGDIDLSYTFFDLNGDEDLSLIEWTLNGTEMTAFENLTTIPMENISTWDIWMANVTPYDGFNFGETVSSNVLVITPERVVDPNYLIVYSELHPGVELDTELEWVDWAGTASIDFILDETAPDGFEVAKVVKTGTDSWWGVSVHTIPQDTGDLSDFATGTLHFWIKTEYSKELRVGFNNFSPTQDFDAWVTLDAGYGYANDGQWHHVTIPVADIVAANPSVNPSSLDNVFALLFGLDGVQNDVPIYFDNVYYEKGQTPLVSDVNIHFDPTDNGLKLEYTFSDPQGDDDHSLIQWYKNGVLMSEFTNQTVVPESALFRDDVWYVIVTPYDGANWGAAVQSNNATVPSIYPEAPADTATDDTATDDGGGFSIPGYPMLALLGAVALSLVVFKIKRRKS